MQNSLQKKYDDLRKALQSYPSAGVAFSAGVDSTLLLAVAAGEIEGPVVAFTAQSAAFPQNELSWGKAFCAEHAITQITFDLNELAIAGFSDNPSERCYLCKHALFKKMSELAAAYNIRALLEGSNVDDLDEYRPGRRALEEFHMISPLQACGFTKEDVRNLSYHLNLETYDKPAQTCYYTRFATGSKLDLEDIERVAQAEEFLQSLGFSLVRVRSEEDVETSNSNGSEKESDCSELPWRGRYYARIELPLEDLKCASDEQLWQKIESHLKTLGFSHVVLDQKGYQRGSMSDQT